MEFHSEVGHKSKHQNEITETSRASCSRPRTKLRDVLMSDKPALLYAGLGLSKSSGRQQSHGTQGKAREDDRVKHIPKLYKHNPVPNKNSGYSPSTSSSSYFSTDGSSSSSSRGNSSSPGHQRRHRSPSQARLETSLVKNYIQDEDVNTFRRNAASNPSHISRKQRICVLDQNYSTNQSGTRPDTTSEMGKQQNGNNLDLASYWKGKMKFQGSELKEEIMQSHVSVHFSGDPSQYSRSSHFPYSSASDNKIPEEKGLKSLYQKDDDMKFHCSDSYSIVPFSCPLPSTEGGTGDPQSEMRESCSIATTLVDNNSPQKIKSLSRNRNAVDVKLGTGFKSSTAAKLSGVLDKTLGPESTSKVRQPSPIRRLSSAVGSFIRSAGSRENSPLRRSNSKDAVDRAAAPISLHELDKSQVNSRAKSSPLRRLLDPIFKSKAQNGREIAQLPFMKDSSKEEPVIAKSTFERNKASHQNQKQGSTLMQALLQVSVKNGPPLFTFAVDNDSDILAATLKKLSSSEKNCPSWIYTFFTVHEIKRKNGLWLNHGTKGNGQSYVPNVLAQMKVSNPQFCVDIKQKGINGVSLREFTLFSVDTSQVDRNATEFQPTKELAAIVAKILKPPNDKSDEHSIRSQTLLSSTVILPGDVHTIPSKGPISTLTQRWRSGGSCDCGGWDVGCQLRIFNQGKCEKSSNSLKTAISPEEFKLFSQVGQETQPVLSLKPYKDRIYSVEFDSSISLLQAFATSVAVLDCRRSLGLVSDNDRVEGRASTSVNNESQGEAPASHVSYPPPHSPVGRV